MARFVCPEAGCGLLLTAYVVRKAGHQIDQESGYLFVDDGNVESESRWKILCERGHLVGAFEVPDGDGDFVPTPVEMWLRGRLWTSQESTLPSPIEITLAAGKLLSVTDANGTEVAANVDETGPIPWANCAACDTLHPAGDLERDSKGAWLCFSCLNSD